MLLAWEAQTCWGPPGLKCLALLTFSALYQCLAGRMLLPDLPVCCSIQQHNLIAGLAHRAADCFWLYDFSFHLQRWPHGHTQFKESADSVLSKDTDALF